MSAASVAHFLMQTASIKRMSDNSESGSPDLTVTPSIACDYPQWKDTHVVEAGNQGSVVRELRVNIAPPGDTPIYKGDYFCFEGKETVIEGVTAVPESGAATRYELLLQAWGDVG